MNEQLFKQNLEQLTEADWRSLFEGQDLLIKDDRELFVGAPDSPNSILHSSDFSVTDVPDLKAQVLNKANEVLSDYYRTNPLTNKGFNHQVEKLVEELGVEAFCAPEGKIANRTFFVEGGEVVSESVESPRHRYGVFFEVEQHVSEGAIKGAFYKWLLSGQAYSEYIGMNVCRYNC